MAEATKKIITLQPAAGTDQITEDGTELQQLPYPFHVFAEDGSIDRQDFWMGDPLRVIGFAEKLDRRQIDLRWRDAARNPQRAVGMYVVTQDQSGGMAVHLSAIAKVEVHEL